MEPVLFHLYSNICTAVVPEDHSELLECCAELQKCCPVLLPDIDYWWRHLVIYCPHCDSKQFLLTPECEYSLVLYYFYGIFIHFFYISKALSHFSGFKQHFCRMIFFQHIWWAAVSTTSFLCLPPGICFSPRGSIKSIESYHSGSVSKESQAISVASQKQACSACINFWHMVSTPFQLASSN